MPPNRIADAANSSRLGKLQRHGPDPAGISLAFTKDYTDFAGSATRRAGSA
jgi:hypothetical protein